MKDSKNPDGGVDENKVVKDEFMGNVSEEEDKIDDLFGEARPGEGVGKVEDFDEEPEEDAEPKKVRIGRSRTADTSRHRRPQCRPLPLQELV